MTNDEFREAVRKMREAQNTYFAQTTTENLNASKRLEERVDEELLDKKDKPLTLF